MKSTLETGGAATAIPKFKLATRKRAIKTYMVRAYHEGCGGELVGTERGVAVWPAAWEHRCTKCGETNMVIGANYPMIAHDDKKGR
jgi:hypothetical protein